ncbi:multidrug DMT transporter permease [Legionella norrlandica]|uniref:Multidrug DMT transporter permease n=1 Tax=Legionella norrlandica TaxID=1498499 RepID=A0A0A2SMS7_9GAMM|nr:multidrug DMT transporter permease [Legionella norrlandica]KGP62400.1 multidrug DMT transporter permease [Legionella norrlandica]
MYRWIVPICISLLFPFSTHAGKSDCINRHCIAVVDAGSSSSRLHIYAYDLDETNTPIEIREIWNRKAVPGLSTIEHEHKSVSAYMENLFSDAPAVLMPVYFYSTAGMRLLPKTHHKDINQMVADWFDRQYYWRLVTARTISGTEEGVFAWLATNYQLNLFKQELQPLVGVMDIGGASVQIIIPILNPSTFKHDHTSTINLYGKQYTVFSHSFLGLGQNEMGHQFFDLKFCFPDEYELPSGRLARGDAYACKDEIAILVNSVHSVSRKIKSILAANPIEKWYVLGGITFMLNDKIFSLDNQYFTNRELISFADENICHQKWTTLEEKYPANYIVFNYCMLPSYLYALMVHGYGLKSYQKINFMPVSKNIDWTIGVVLQHKQS